MTKASLDYRLVDLDYQRIKAERVVISAHLFRTAAALSNLLAALDNDEPSDGPVMHAAIQKARAALRNLPQDAENKERVA